MDEQIKTIPKPPETDYILSSFHELQEQGAVDAGGFHVSSMNDCVRRGKSLPPVVVLYPNIVLEGDLCIIFGQSGIGKTIFAMQVARDIAAKGKRVLYADFEMTLASWPSATSLRISLLPSSVRRWTWKLQLAMC